MKCSINPISNQRKVHLKNTLTCLKSSFLGTYRQISFLGTVTVLITRATLSSSYGEMLTLPHYETIDGQLENTFTRV